MNPYILSLLIAACSGAVWSILQFVIKYLDPSNASVTEVSDFRWSVFLRTVGFNTIGGACAVAALFLLGTVPGWEMSIINGLYGEQGIKLLIAAKDKLRNR